MMCVRCQVRYLQQSIFSNNGNYKINIVANVNVLLVSTRPLFPVCKIGHLSPLFQLNPRIPSLYFHILSLWKLLLLFLKSVKLIDCGDAW